MLNYLRNIFLTFVLWLIFWIFYKKILSSPGEFEKNKICKFLNSYFIYCCNAHDILNLPVSNCEQNFEKNLLLYFYVFQIIYYCITLFINKFWKKKLKLCFVTIKYCKGLRIDTDMGKKWSSSIILLQIILKQMHWCKSTGNNICYLMVWIN